MFSEGLKDEFETAGVNEPSVFEALKFYCSVYVISGLMAFWIDKYLSFYFVSRSSFPCLMLGLRKLSLSLMVEEVT